VHLGGDERERLEQPDRAERPGRRRIRRLAGDPVEDGDVFGQDLAALEDERQYEPLGLIIRKSAPASVARVARSTLS
jgi:hypothetical protein